MKFIKDTKSNTLTLQKDSTDYSFGFRFKGADLVYMQQV